jgi:hypothetical protein
MFSVALAVAPTPSSVGRASNAAVVAQLMKRERSSWTALQRHDKQAWESLLSDNYSHVNSNGTQMDREGVINMFEGEVVESYVPRLQYQETPMSPRPSNPKDATRSPVLNHDEWQ